VALPRSASTGGVEAVAAHEMLPSRRNMQRHLGDEVQGGRAAVGGPRALPRAPCTIATGDALQPLGLLSLHVQAADSKIIVRRAVHITANPPMSAAADDGRSSPQMNVSVEGWPCVTASAAESRGASTALRGSIRTKRSVVRRMTACGSKAQLHAPVCRDRVRGQGAGDILADHPAGKPLRVPLTNPTGCDVRRLGKDAKGCPR